MNHAAKRLVNEYRWEEGTAIAHVKSGGFCEYCGDDLLSSRKTYFAMEIDHLLPKHVHVDQQFNYDNYVTSCASCNHAKGRWNPLEDGEDALAMLGGSRGTLIERVRLHLNDKFERQQQEFESVRGVIRPRART